jgi:hypothetical protein
MAGIPWPPENDPKIARRSVGSHENPTDSDFDVTGHFPGRRGVRTSRSRRGQVWHQTFAGRVLSHTEPKSMELLRIEQRPHLQTPTNCPSFCPSTPSKWMDSGESHRQLRSPELVQWIAESRSRPL